MARNTIPKNRVVFGILGTLLFWYSWQAWNKNPESTPSLRPQPIASPAVLQGERLDSAPPSTDPKSIRNSKDLSPLERAELSQELDSAPQREGYISLSFSTLADFECSEAVSGETPKIPEEILDLDQKTVGITGFMVPIELEAEKVSRFILLRNQLLCCYGEEPAINEWVYVALDKPVPPVVDKAIAIYGRLESSPDVVDGQLVSLYRMNGHSLQILE